jgi:hypothetical protein
MRFVSTYIVTNSLSMKLKNSTGFSTRTPIVAL